MADKIQAPVVVIAATVLVIAATAFFVFPKKKKGPIALDPQSYIPFKLIEREEVSHDTRRFRFGLQSDQHVLGLPFGQHISLKFVGADGKEVSRSYTPISSDDDLGYVDFVIKVYYPRGDIPGGKMSMHLDGLKIGETILMMGPKGKLTYKGRGRFDIKVKADVNVRKAKQVGMIAGGTGITPMLQIARAMLKDPKDTTKINLLFANQSEDDILLKKELDEVAAQYPDRFKLWYTLDRASDKWKYSVGFVSADMIKEHLPAPGPDTQVLVCGPPGMIKFACLPAFEKLGYTEEMYFTF